MELIIISGMSGAGKSKAVGALEDVGYYCIDNIPPRIMPMFADLCLDSDKREIQKVAMVVDARSREMFSELDATLTDMKNRRLPYKILFLDASDDVLLQRFRETRRRHPLADDATPLPAAVATERALLRPLREMADFIVDTSQTLPAQLRERVIGLLSEQKDMQPMSIACMSFGFRHGLPPEADLVFDVRCLPNPFYIAELRDHAGDEPCVRDYVMGFPEAQQLFARLEELLAFSVPLYVREGKSQLTIAVGCTGGRHRSVAAAERLSGFLRGRGYRVTVSHRDKGKAAQR